MNGYDVVGWIGVGFIALSILGVSLYIFADMVELAFSIALFFAGLILITVAIFMASLAISDACQKAGGRIIDTVCVATTVSGIYEFGDVVKVEIR